jgi:hypothetical protein
MEFTKLTSIDKKKDFYLNPNYICLVTPYNEDGGTVITSIHGEFHVEHDVDHVGACVDFLVKFSNSSNGKVFYINPSFVVEVVPGEDGITRIITHVGEFSVGLGMDETAAYLNEGLSKLNR